MSFFVEAKLKVCVSAVGVVGDSVAVGVGVGVPLLHPELVLALALALGGVHVLVEVGHDGEDDHVDEHEGGEHEELAGLWKKKLSNMIVNEFRHP